jgi:hypothetical protein
MFPIIPFILLWVRLAHFRKLTTAQLPRATEDDLRSMRKASTTAFYIMLAFTILSFVPYGFMSVGHVEPAVYGVNGIIQQERHVPGEAGYVSFAVAIFGLLVAAVFDFKAERIKKRCRAETPGSTIDEIRWYHIVVAVMLPYAALPWGIVNLVKKRRRSGLVLVLISGFLLLVAVVTIVIGVSSGK